MTDRPTAPNVLAITFLYYKDLPRAFAFYRDVMGFPLAIDQGDLAKILEIAPNAHVGLVDEAKGMNRWQQDKCVQLCVRVEDVEAWYAYLGAKGVDNLSQMFRNEKIGIRAFVFRDPEGYQVEIQEAIRAEA
ncbi:VOC family protein [Roseicyclus persicicus]|uniref:VOC family protein n=1 Tax=Roseicyclus persicicus TaxID=2650661 RepID=A0A7X6GWP0_9RHOB|nr:VOC family protein [Roseibacterium persicicum]NKX43791.1 VOC family protein [Roseibacterium persicicum]